MNRLPVALLSCVILFLWGCGSSAPVVVESEEVPEIVAKKGLPYIVFTEHNGVLMALDLQGKEDRKIGNGGKVVFRSVSPDGKRVVLGMRGAESSELYLYDQVEKTRVVLYSGERETVFSGRWDEPSSQFYFGQYLPEGKRMGAGSIHTYSVTHDELSQVPCSASRMVLSVLSNESILVRNSDSIYEVATSDCATLKTIDARKWYHVSVSPSNDRLAYVLRDLVYNRDTRAYEPDSALYLADISGADPVKVIGDKYEPRNMAWSPDGSELAYDVNVQDGSGRRAVSLYSIDSGRSSYLEPPDATPNSNSHPLFSLDGSTVSYRSASEGGKLDTMWKSAGEPFSRAVPGDSDHAMAFELVWIGAQKAFVRQPNGFASILNVASGDGVTEWSGKALFAVDVR